MRSTSDRSTMPSGSGLSPDQHQPVQLVSVREDGLTSASFKAFSRRSVRMSSQPYLLADQPSELERLQLQSRVWEPSGRRLLDEIGEGPGDRVLDVGCGAIGWLRLLSEWVGPDGEVVGTDIDDAMLAAAGQFVDSEGLGNVVLMKDDLFASKLESSSFDLVHARFQIAPLGRGRDQIANHVRLLRPGGTVALEEWDVSSWNFNPPVRALDSLVELIGQSFAQSGGDMHVGRKLLDLLRGFGIEGNVRAEVLALPPGHPYLRLPLQFAAALEERLLSIVTVDELEQLRKESVAELEEPGRWGTTFTLVQCWGQSAA
jgi:SAM-dependent methyltransferase